VRLGVPVHAVALLGGPNGERIAGLLRREGIPATAIASGAPTRLKRIPDGDETRATLHDVHPVAAERVRAAIAEAAALVAPGAIAVISGSLPAGTPAELETEAVAALREAGARVYLDAAGATLRAGLRGAPHAIKPNAEEFAALPGAGAGPLAAAPVEATRAHLGVEELLVTLGASGAIAATAEGTFAAAADRIAVRTTLGAGDAFLGGWIAARLAGRSAAECLAAAMASARRHVAGEPQGVHPRGKPLQG
jgi:1-phosphofructokinase